MKTLWKAITALIVLLSIAASSFLISFNVYASQFDITDPYTDIQYNITQSGDKVTITDHYNTFYIPVDYSIIDVSCFAGNITFLCTSENGKYMIYLYNISTENLRYFQSDLTDKTSNPAFTSDNYGNVYIADSPDKNTLYVISEYSLYSYTCPDYINQLMCLDGERILTFTESGVFIFYKNTFSKISGIKPITPCLYTSNGTISDINADTFLYQNNTLKALNPEVPTTPENSSDKPYDSNDVAIENGCIYIPQGTTYANLCKFFDVDKSDIKILKQNSTPLSSGKLGTGMTLTYNSDKYTLIVLGDLTGEGNINSRDLSTLMKHLTGESLLSKNAEKAADISIDNTINTKDLVTLARLY